MFQGCLRTMLKANPMPESIHHIVPDGAEIRELIENETVGLAHCRLPAGKVSSPERHKTVSELWTILSGTGKMWRQSGAEEREDILAPGVSIDIPVGTAFQYRCDGEEDLCFFCITTPLWPGADESERVQGKW